MHFRYHLGRLPGAVHSWLLSRPWFPLFRRFRGGRDWRYDVCRFADTRDFRVVFDVGANVGTVSLELARFFPAATVHAFEPMAAVFETLRENCARRPQIAPHRLALSDSGGEAFLDPQTCSELNSLARTAAVGAVGAIGADRVEITTLDVFCTEHRVERIDLLKVDAQGFDLAVLRGAEALLRAQCVPFIVVEAGLQPDDTVNQPFAPLHAYLTAEGYRVAGIYEQLNYGPRLSYLGCFNLLYLHPDAVATRFPSVAASA